eukprot:PLAT3314.4.p2 GENE.PLAT3314.4~~PLAT3314.4.p2  ORF type:complete len:785 (+),score=255.17 PLAT3314.4:41-2356(+)
MPRLEPIDPEHTDKTVGGARDTLGAIAVAKFFPDRRRGPPSPLWKATASEGAASSCSRRDPDSVDVSSHGSGHGMSIATSGARRMGRHMRDLHAVVERQNERPERPLQHLKLVLLLTFLVSILLACWHTLEYRAALNHSETFMEGLTQIHQQRFWVARLGFTELRLHHSRTLSTELSDSGGETAAVESTAVAAAREQLQLAVQSCEAQLEELYDNFHRQVSLTVDVQEVRGNGDVRVRELGYWTVLYELVSKGHRVAQSSQFNGTSADEAFILTNAPTGVRVGMQQLESFFWGHASAAQGELEAVDGNVLGVAVAGLLVLLAGFGVILYRIDNSRTEVLRLFFDISPEVTSLVAHRVRKLLAQRDGNLEDLLDDLGLDEDDDEDDGAGSKEIAAALARAASDSGSGGDGGGRSGGSSGTLSIRRSRPVAPEAKNIVAAHLSRQARIKRKGWDGSATKLSMKKIIGSSRHWMFRRSWSMFGRQLARFFPLFAVAIALYLSQSLLQTRASQSTMLSPTRARLAGRRLAGSAEIYFDIFRLLHAGEGNATAIMRQVSSAERDLRLLEELVVDDEQSTLLFRNACFREEDRSECEASVDGALTHGLQPAMTHFLEFAAFVLQDALRRDCSAPELACRPLLDSADAQMMSQLMENTFFHAAMVQSLDRYVIHARELLDVALLWSWIDLLCFVVVSCALYTLLLRAQLTSVKDEVKYTRSLLLTMPEKVVRSLPSLRAYVREHTGQITLSKKRTHKVKDGASEAGQSTPSSDRYRVV